MHVVTALSPDERTNLGRGIASLSAQNITINEMMTPDV